MRTVYLMTVTTLCQERRQVAGLCIGMERSGPSQLLYEVAEHALLLVLKAPGVPGHMPLLGKQQDVVRLVRGCQRSEQPAGVPEVHVLIDHAVHDQQLA